MPFVLTSYIYVSVPGGLEQGWHLELESGIHFLILNSMFVLRPVYKIEVCTNRIWRGDVFLDSFIQNVKMGKHRSLTAT